MSNVFLPWVIKFECLPADGGRSFIEEFRAATNHEANAEAAARALVEEHNQKYPYEEKWVFSEILSIRFKPWQPRY